MSEVKECDVAWIWEKWLPLRMLSILDGDPGLGKSTITLDLAARLSRGEVMPDGTEVSEAAGTVMLTIEDDIAAVVKPRLIAANADTSRIATVEFTDTRGVLRSPVICDSDLKAVAVAARDVDAKLVIVDPLVAFMPDEVNANRDQHVRRVLARLQAFAAAANVAVVAVRHLNKNETGTNTLYRGGGSIGIIAAARSGLVLARDPDDRDGERRVLACHKSNVSVRPSPLRCRMIAAGGCARVEWNGTSHHTPESLLAPAAPTEALCAKDEAKDFLREALLSGPVAARDVEREAAGAGIAKETIRRARRALGIRARKVGAPGSADQRWVWSLPDTDDPLRGSDSGNALSSADAAEEGHLDEEGHLTGTEADHA